MPESKPASPALFVGRAPPVPAAASRVYQNQGNVAALELLGPDCRRLLDVGCGAGDNAARLRSLRPGLEIHGVTHSEAEAELARPHLDRCWLFDIEQPWPPELARERFDALLFSHVLEHLREPSRVLAGAAELLRPGGSVIIALPNVLAWRQRLAFLLRRFEYQETGVLDATHLRFFTYFSADQLLAGGAQLTLVDKRVTGSVPLGWLRRTLLPRGAAVRIDALGCRWLPNLFGSEILLRATKP